MRSKNLPATGEPGRTIQILLPATPGLHDVKELVLSLKTDKEDAELDFLVKGLTAGGMGEAREQPSTVKGHNP